MLGKLSAPALRLQTYIKSNQWKHSPFLLPVVGRWFVSASESQHKAAATHIYIWLEFGKNFNTLDVMSSGRGPATLREQVCWRYAIVRLTGSHQARRSVFELLRVLNHVLLSDQTPMPLSFKRVALSQKTLCMSEEGGMKGGVSEREGGTASTSSYHS